MNIEDPEVIQWSLNSHSGRSRQKPRFLPAETKLVSEKSAAGDFFQ